MAGAMYNFAGTPRRQDNGWYRRSSRPVVSAGAYDCLGHRSRGAVLAHQVLCSMMGRRVLCCNVYRHGCQVSVTVGPNYVPGGDVNATLPRLRSWMRTVPMQRVWVNTTPSSQDLTILFIRQPSASVYSIAHSFAAPQGRPRRASRNARRRAASRAAQAAPPAAAEGTRCDTLPEAGLPSASGRADVLRRYLEDAATFNSDIGESHRSEGLWDLPTAVSPHLGSDGESRDSLDDSSPVTFAPIRQVSLDLSEESLCFTDLEECLTPEPEEGAPTLCDTTPEVPSSPPGSPSPASDSSMGTLTDVMERLRVTARANPEAAIPYLRGLRDLLEKVGDEVMFLNDEAGDPLPFGEALSKLTLRSAQEQAGKAIPPPITQSSVPFRDTLTGSTYAFRSLKDESTIDAKLDQVCTSWRLRCTSEGEETFLVPPMLLKKEDGTYLTVSGHPFPLKNKKW